MSLGRQTASGGVELAVLREGAGPVLVLVHGGFVDSRLWSAVIPMLAERRTVIAVDRRGHGASPAYSGAHALSDDIADLVEIVMSTGETVEMFAHSAGCHVALGAVLQGAPVQHLVLYEAPTFGEPMIDDEVWQRFDDAAAREDRPALVEIVLNDVVGRSIGREVHPPPVLAGILASPFGSILLDNALSIPTELRAHERHVWTDDGLRALATRTSLVISDPSPPFIRRFADRIAALTSAQLVRRPGADHATPTIDPRAILDVLDSD